MWGEAAPSHARGDGGGDGGSGGRLPALEPGSLRLQLAGGQWLGGRVAWDAASGLLAAELQTSEGGSTIPVAIFDPQSPESHFVAHVPAATPGEHLAALLWSARAARRLLLTVTSSGKVYSWTMSSGRKAAAGGPAAAAGGRGAGNGSGSNGSNGGDLAVQCINEWIGHHAFDLPLAPAGDSPASAGQQQQSVLCCRFLEPPAAGAAWEADAAPPFLDRPMTTNEVVSYYQQRGLEQAFVSPASAAAVASSPQADVRPGLDGLHWLRPGMLCLAVVTSGGQLLLTIGNRQLGTAGGAGSGGEPGSGGSSIAWLPMPAVQLPVPVVGGGGHPPQLAQADVAAVAGGSLLVAAAGRDQQLLLEVAGPPPQLVAAVAGGSLQQEAQQQRMSQLSLPPSLAQPGTATLQLTFLPSTAVGSGGTGASTRLLLLTSSADAGTSAQLLTCHSDGNGAGWRVEGGASRRLCPTPLPAAASAASPDGSIAVLLPSIQLLLHLSGSSLMPCRDTQGAPLPAGPAGAAGSAAGSAAGTAGAAIAASPHCLYAAVGAPGASALLLLPLLPQPRQPFDVEHFMLKIGKRCCLALAMHSTPSACWDVTSAAAAACAVWGHQHLQLTQQLVDAAALATRPEARGRHVLAWGRLKAALLAAATAAHPAAAGDHTAAAVRADAAAREWMAAAADIFDLHKPDRLAVAIAAKEGAAAYTLQLRSALQKMLPTRYWAMWVAEFSVFFTRCLLYWCRLSHARSEGAVPAAAPVADESHEADWQTVAASLTFVAEQNAGADCLPCIRLLSDGPFYRSVGRVVNGALQLARLIERHPGGKAGPMSSLLQQLQVLQDAGVLLRHLNESFKTNCGNAAVEDSTRTPEVAGVGYSGAWTLVCTPPAPAVTIHQVRQGIQQLKERPGGGKSPLVERVREAWGQQGDSGGARDSAAALLATASHLCLLPPQSSGGVTAASRLAVWGAPATAAAAAAAAAAAGCNGGVSASRLTALLQQRGVALAAAEVGDGPVPLPPREQPGDWPEWSMEVDAPSPSKPAAGQQPGGPSGWQQHSWEAERDAALGLAPRPPPPDDPAAYIGRLDPLSGRLLSWEHPVTYAAADGSCATAELQPRSQLPLGMAEEGWQAAFAFAAPVGGQPWKRVRVA